MLLAPLVVRADHPMWRDKNKSLIGARIMVPVAMNMLWCCTEVEGLGGGVAPYSNEWTDLVNWVRQIAASRDFEDHFDPDDWPMAKKVTKVDDLPTAMFMAGVNVSNGFEWHYNVRPDHIAYTNADCESQLILKLPSAWQDGNKHDVYGPDACDAWFASQRAFDAPIGVGPRPDQDWLSSPRAPWSWLIGDCQDHIIYSLAMAISFNGPGTAVKCKSLRAVNKQFKTILDNRLEHCMEMLDMCYSDARSMKYISEWMYFKKWCEEYEVAPWLYVEHLRFKRSKPAALRFLRLKLEPRA
jgi:hypothetical protein